MGATEGPPSHASEPVGLRAWLGVGWGVAVWVRGLVVGRASEEKTMSKGHEDLAAAVRRLESQASYQGTTLRELEARLETAEAILQPLPATVATLAEQELDELLAYVQAAREVIICELSLEDVDDETLGDLAARVVDEADAARIAANDARGELATAKSEAERLFVVATKAEDALVCAERKLAHCRAAHSIGLERRCEIKAERDAALASAATLRSELAAAVDTLSRLVMPARPWEGMDKDVCERCGNPLDVGERCVCRGPVQWLDGETVPVEPEPMMADPRSRGGL